MIPKHAGTSNLLGGGISTIHSSNRSRFAVFTRKTTRLPSRQGFANATVTRAVMIGRLMPQGVPQNFILMNSGGTACPSPLVRSQEKGGNGRPHAGYVKGFINSHRGWDAYSTVRMIWDT